ncbi:MAG TPA: glycosyltransferase family 9 protein [Bryobacteraceae bacterium]|nr:glycosyltransferase family 9 protein [Bryobacteraceae bacterium]
MSTVLECLPRGSRIAILRLRSLGDCVLTTPALDILKRFRPDLRLAVMVEDRFRAIFEDNPDVDEILPPELGRLRQNRPRLCLNLHGGTRSAWMTALSGARYRAGFGHFRHQFVYNVRIPRAQQILGVDRTVHTAEHVASAIFFLGAPRIEIPRAKLVAPGKSSPERSRIKPDYAVIHAVAATPAKTWHANGFVAVAEQLQHAGIEPVFIGGTGDDLAPFRAWRSVLAAPLAEVKSLIAGACVFVGNDSGPAHMAAAFGIPSVVIFGASNSAIWGPWRTAAEVVSAPGRIASVETGQVLDALARLGVHA